MNDCLREPLDSNDLLSLPGQGKVDIERQEYLFWIYVVFFLNAGTTA